jgi:uroporphyrin-III C-methyltransferase
MSVTLVGAGPGDPGLITQRGLAAVRRCDVLVYDRLVAEELVGEAPPLALRIDRESLSQEEISDLLVQYARAGLAVVRLKGGDPFVFGRGGEEAVALASAGVPFEVVPGVSALAAVPAAAGIPITHRGVAAQVTLVAGHAPERLDYEQLATAPGTLVVFMGLGGVAEIAAGLIAAGRDPETPAAVIESGTLAEQRVATAPLAGLAEAAGTFSPPALIVVGDVVALAEDIQPGLEHLLSRV